MAYARCSDTTDLSSLSNSADLDVHHIDLDWSVDFAASTLSGTASLVLASLVPGLTQVVLDTRDLAVASVSVDGAPAAFKLGESGIFGAALTVALAKPVAAGDKITVKVAYATSPESSALQWLAPEQTAGKKRPYLFSQCQAIHARSLLPCVDAPGKKATYSATVRAPKWATVLMSALQVGEAAEVPSSSSSGMRSFQWRQPVATSTYLIAVAVGELESRDISPRCRVWSEPSMVSAVAFEFSQTEDFLQAAEELAGPYRWTRYDLLCLPPSFPYGGMENPCLTFVTPTLLAGDRSLADVVAHEIAHSWTGNLVTNASWSHFWLNEGWTRWFELSIMAKIQGDPRYFDLRASLGYEGLKASVDYFMANGESHLTALVPPLDGIDPDDAFSSVPYERGMALLRHMETTVGAAAFGDFFRAYVRDHAATTLTSDGFRRYAEAHFRDRAPGGGLQGAVDWEAWFLQEGMPPVAPAFDLSLVQPVHALADQVVSGGLDSATALPVTDFDALPSLQQQLFLQALLDRALAHQAEDAAATAAAAKDQAKGATAPLLSPATLHALDDRYRLSSKGNSELVFKWCMLCLLSGRAEILKTAANFLCSQGRMKFVRPLYRALLDTRIPGGRELAVGTFAANRGAYHPICRKMVASDIDKALAKQKEAPAAAAAAPSQGQAASFLAGMGFGLGFAVVLGLALKGKPNR